MMMRTNKLTIKFHFILFYHTLGEEDMRSSLLLLSLPTLLVLLSFGNIIKGSHAFVVPNNKSGAMMNRNSSPSSVMMMMIQKSCSSHHKYNHHHHPRHSVIRKRDMYVLYVYGFWIAFLFMSLSCAVFYFYLLVLFLFHSIPSIVPSIKLVRLRRCIVPSRFALQRTKSSSSSSSRLCANDNNDNDNHRDRTPSSALFDSLDKVKLTIDNFWIALKDKLPNKMVLFLELFFSKLSTLLPSMRLAALSFLAGMVLTFGTLLVLPAASNLEAALTEPVTLFETILTDLDRAYVDQVDTQKLFETGVSAMLRSLDPYTEFEGKQEAADLTESIDGKYGGVGLVISGATPKDMALLTKTTAADAAAAAVDKDGNKNNNKSNNNDDDDDGLNDEQLKFVKQVQEKGIRVVSAFEGYAFDAGMRVGDKLVAVDGMPIGPATTVDQVRNRLRGEPGTYVDVSFEREGVNEVQTVSVPRTVVRIRDVKLATMLGNAKDGIGYIQLTGFSSDAGREVRNAILALQQAAEDATNSESSLKGLILDLRGNPGGLLTSAVDVVSCLVPKGSDIVSARGRGFPGVLYRSRSEPVLDSRTKLAVLVNGGTASAAEIVSGAVQDLDVGIIVGADRTFGKGLVQNVQDLPFNTALKFTVAKYYTPSGRCIQGIQYTEGGGLNAADGGKYQANKVADKDKTTFYTKRGREVQDGGGIEADYKVSAPKASALEVTLLRSGIVNDFAAQWSRTHELTNHFEVDEDTYKDFQTYVQQKQKNGDIKLEALYSGPINDLRRILEQSEYKGSTKDLEQLQASIVRDLMNDFDKYRTDIKEDLATGILARYLPESMLIERSIRTDAQVQAALKLVKNDNQFAKLLAKGSSDTESSSRIEASSTVDVALATKDEGKLKLMKW